MYAVRPNVVTVLHVHAGWYLLPGTVEELYAVC